MLLNYYFNKRFGSRSLFKYFFIKIILLKLKFNLHSQTFDAMISAISDIMSVILTKQRLYLIATTFCLELGNKRSQRNNERLSNYIATGGIVTGLIIYLTLYILIKNRPENLDGLENDWLQCFVNICQTSFSLCHIVHNLYIKSILTI